jgi:formiminotetrahydrofolate cyclodeaminase
MTDTPLRQFVQELAARTPTPGGGAAAAQAGAMGAALLTMVVRFTLGKRDRTAADESALQEAERALIECTERMMPMAERDMASFERVAAAYKLPKSTEGEKVVRSRAIQEALHGAMVVPEELVYHVRDALAAMAPIADQVGRNIGADLGTGVALLYAAARSGSLLVQTNASYLLDRDHARLISGRSDELMREIRSNRDALQKRAEELTR